MALRVLAHFVPGDKVLEFLAPETDWLDIRYCAEDDDDTFYRELPEAEVIWHVLRPLSGSDLERAPQCRLVHKLGAGVNTIDVETATRLGIAVANMPGANAASVAEGAVLLMLAALRRLPALDRATRAGTGWPSDPSLGETVRDIGGCTVGLVGYGNIAKRVETIVTAMGADVLHTSTGDDGHPGWRPLPDLLAASDIVSLHLPLTADTSNMFDAAALALMKPGAVLVNTSRGPIVDEDALVDALRGGRLAAAGPGRVRRRADIRRQPAAGPRQRRAHPARHLVHRRHHAPLSGRSRRQLPPDPRRPGAGQRRERGQCACPSRMRHE